MKKFKEYNKTYYKFKIIDQLKFFNYLMNDDSTFSLKLETETFDTFDEIINNIIDSFSYNFAIDGYNVFYTIEKYYKKYKVKPDEEFEIWKETNKYNL